jgi:hypothetical protein
VERNAGQASRRFIDIRGSGQCYRSIHRTHHAH